MLTSKDIERLYFYESEKGQRWIQLWRDFAHKNTCNNGDIALFEDDCGNICHAAIVVSCKNFYISVIEILKSHVKIRKNILLSSDMHFIDYNKACGLVKSIDGAW